MISLERLRLFLFVLAASLGAGAIWAGVTSALSTPPEKQPLPGLSAVGAPRAARRDDRTPESFEALTRRKFPLLPPAPVSAAMAGPPPFKLVAIWSVSAVVKGSDGTVGTYKAGDLVKPDGAKVVSVELPRATFLWHGAPVTLTLDGISASAPTASVPERTEFVVTPEDWSAAYRDWVANPNVGQRGLRMEKEGVRLLDGMPENFPARKYGLLPGDLVRRVNGSVLNSPLVIADLLKSMSSPQGFTLEVERAGKTFPIKIRLGQPPKP